MKKVSIIIILFILVGIFGLFGFATMLTNKYTSTNRTDLQGENSSISLFYQYSEADKIFSWNLYNGEKASFYSTKSGYLYYIFNSEDEKNKENQLLISKGDFPFWFNKDLKYSSDIFNGKSEEKKLDIGKDLRNGWNSNNINYPTSDIKNKYNIKRKVTLETSHTDNRDQKGYHTAEYYSDYMDIYVNSNNDIIYAVPEDIGQISYVTKDEVNTDAVQESTTLLEGNKKNNINNIIDSLGEPNYAIATSDNDSTKLTYVWYIFDNYYFYYTMQVDYYINGAYIEKNTLRSSLKGNNISDFEYGIVDKDYIYYTNNELARLFNAKDKNYNLETWISIDE